MKDGAKTKNQLHLERMSEFAFHGECNSFRKRTTVHRVRENGWYRDNELSCKTCSARKTNKVEKMKVQKSKIGSVEDELRETSSSSSIGGLQSLCPLSSKVYDDLFRLRGAEARSSLQPWSCRSVSSAVIVDSSPYPSIFHHLTQGKGDWGECTVFYIYFSGRVK